MGAEVLIASLWVVVLVYWAWSWRPATRDSLGSFRRELQVMQRGGLARAVPAGRRGTDGTAFLSWYSAVYASLTSNNGAPDQAGTAPVPDAPRADRSPVTYEPPYVPNAPTIRRPVGALSYRRAAMQRRRRAVVGALLAVVVVTLLGALLTGAVVALVLQAFFDVALLTYMYLLIRATSSARAARAGLGQAARRSRGDQLGAPVPVPAAAAELPAVTEGIARHVPLHALPSSWRAFSPTRRPAPSYGDFDSYASLALAQAN